MVKLPKPFFVLISENGVRLKSMLLKNLFIDFPYPIPEHIPEIEISGIAIDSREVKPGFLFVAMKGGSADGHDYIHKALENGAAAIVGETARFNSALYVGVENPRKALTWLSAAFYNWPARKLTVIGVTGTDGKTTTCNLIYKILLTAGIKAGMISTVNAVIGDQVLDTGFHVTTPDAHDVQGYLARMVDSGLTHVVLETTSHGWSQHRVDACEFDIGVVTNITHEHFDEHGNYENYRAAKARLFSNLEGTKIKQQGNPRLAVINRDDRSYAFLNEFIKTNKMNYGMDADTDVRGEEIQYKPSGIEFVAKSKDLRVGIKSHLVGKYNVSNCLAALSASIYGLGIDPDVVAKGILSLENIPGRMESIDLGQNFTAIVDFAHTPNALKVTLEAARQMTRGKIISVFGSAGLRDKEKRRMMAETSIELADITILTAEDPRTESLNGILDEMAAGAVSKGGREGETFWRVPDRGEAIEFAIRLAREGDMVLSCGKGHEQSMCFGRTEYHWDDRVAMRAALAEKMGIHSEGIPYLPSRDTMEEGWINK